MIGRIVGLLAGALIAISGFGMLKPAAFAKYFDFTKLSLGPFAEYRTVVCWMIVAVGAVVALAALQRPTGPERKRKSSPAVFDPAQTEHAPAPAAGRGPLNLGPEPEEHEHEPEPVEPQVDRHDVHKPEPAH